MRGFLAALYLAVCAALVAAAAVDGSAHFVLLGDRTGEAQAGIYQRIWREIAGARPDFVVSVGDTIQGGSDATAENEWQEVRRILEPYRKIPLYLAPGNHDIWSAASERLFRQYAERPPHYSFDAGGVHFTILDNSRSDAWPAAELAFLETDLREHAAAPLKMVVAHRPSWLPEAGLGSTSGRFHRMMKQYGVCCVVTGHVHQLIHAAVESVDYVALPSAGGHLRLNREYEAGWFFGWTEVDVKGKEVSMTVHALDGKVTPLSAWGRAGLLSK
ncbi:MAG: metallophosphoesterase [Candidatus Solibacter sp.]